MGASVLSRLTAGDYRDLLYASLPELCRRRLRLGPHRLGGVDLVAQSGVRQGGLSPAYIYQAEPAHNRRKAATLTPSRRLRSPPNPHPAW